MRSTILIIDDSSDIVEFISSLLYEFDLLAASNGEEAVALIRKNLIDLVISDVMMPVMDGFKLSELIKSDLRTSHIPVLLITAKNALSAKVEGLETGADAYIEKPFDPDYLVAQVKSLLQNRKKVKDYFSGYQLSALSVGSQILDDKTFMEDIFSYIKTELRNGGLDVDLLAKYTNLSRISLYRKIKSLSGMSPHELIISTRLNIAAELLLKNKYKIYEVAYMVGFGSQNHFAKSFHKHFSITPSDYMDKKKGKHK